MSKLAALAGSNGAIVAAAAVVAVGAVGAGLWINSNAAQEAPGPAPVVEAAVAPEETAQAPAPEDVAEAPAPEAPVAAPPSIDEVRLEPDGLTIIAGRAAPGSEVSVLLDGAKNTSVTTGPGGSFAAITILPTSSKARVLTVVQRVGIDEVASVDEIILAPRAAPAEVAQAPEQAAPAVDTDAADTVAAAQPDAGDQVVAVEEDAPEAPPATVIASVEPQTPAVDAPVPALNAEPQIPTPALPSPEAAVSEDPAPVPTVSAPAAEAEAPADEPEPVTAPAAIAQAAEPLVQTPDIAEPAAEPEPVQTTEATTPEVAAVEETETLEAQPVETQTVEAEAVGAQTETASLAPADTATPVTVLKSTPDGVEVLGTTPPEALDNIELDTISYSTTGDVQLAGRAQTDADAVRVYVNNRPIADLDVDANGDWSGALPEIDTGVYTLRVDELNKEGTVTSRVETPFRREDPAVLAQTDTSASATQITVQAGATLWAIARDRYGEGLLYVEVFEANRDRIRNPDLIFPGQVFALPN